VTYLVSIDPGIGKTNATGVAIWRDDGSMLSCFGVRPGAQRLEARVRGVVATTRMHIEGHIEGSLPRDVVIEIPRIYLGKGKGDLNDLIDLAVLAGGLSTLGTSAYFVTPSEWKGQTPKDVMAVRVRAKLTPQELALFNACDCPASLRHNVLDAIGIGLWKIGR
jgi:hypothetical protein